MTLPMTTLPIAAASSLARFSVSRTTTAPRSVAGVALSEPLNVPMAVRTGLQRTISRALMGRSPCRKDGTRPNQPHEASSSNSPPVKYYDHHTKSQPYTFRSDARTILFGDDPQVPDRPARHHRLGGGDNALRVDPVMTIEVLDRAGLAKMLDAERAG